MYEPVWYSTVLAQKEVSHSLYHMSYFTTLNFSQKNVLDTLNVLLTIFMSCIKLCPQNFKLNVKRFEFCAVNEFYG